MDRWCNYSDYLIDRYGHRVYRVGIDGGFTCPNRGPDGRGGCIYCDAKGSSAVYQRQDEQGFSRDSTFMASIDAQTDTSRPKTLAERKASIDRQVARGNRFIESRYGAAARSIYFQAFTSTYDELETLRQLYDHALQSGSYTEFIVSTRPDCLSDEVIDLLASYHRVVDRVWVEVGLQSGNDSTLSWIGRNHTVADYESAVERLHAVRIAVSSHVILGFPQERDPEITRTAQTICRSKPEALKIHNLHVVAGTRLYELYRQDPFPISTREEHVRNTIFLLRRIPADTVIQRFISDTPGHRLAAPRDFGDKNQFLKDLRDEMERQDVYQGDLP